MSLEDKMKLFAGMAPLKRAYEAIELVIPLKGMIEGTCHKLKCIIDSEDFSAVDGEIKTAIESVYRILETAGNGLGDVSVSALFNSNPKA